MRTPLILILLSIFQVMSISCGKKKGGGGSSPAPVAEEQTQTDDELRAEQERQAAEDRARALEEQNTFFTNVNSSHVTTFIVRKPSDFSSLASLSARLICGSKATDKVIFVRGFSRDDTKEEKFATQVLTDCPTATIEIYRRLFKLERAEHYRAQIDVRSLWEKVSDTQGRLTIDPNTYVAQQYLVQ